MEIPNVFRVAEVASIVRATMVSALLVGLAGLVALSFAGYPLAGAGLCLGLAGGGASSRLFQASTSRIAMNPEGRVGRQVGSRTMSRLAVITAIVFVMLVFVLPLGVGALGGLALFQFILVVNIVRMLLKLRRAA